MSNYKEDRDVMQIGTKPELKIVVSRFNYPGEQSTELHIMLDDRDGNQQQYVAINDSVHSIVHDITMLFVNNRLLDLVTVNKLKSALTDYVPAKLNDNWQ